MKALSYSAPETVTSETTDKRTEYLGNTLITDIKRSSMTSVVNDNNSVHIDVYMSL